MCSRYELKARPKDIAERFRVRGEVPLDLAKSEIRPTDPAPIILRVGTLRLALAARFGLSVTWNKMPVINARAETLAQKPTFRLLLKNRCVIPASAYFEWRQDGKARQRNRIALLDKNLMGFAGLFNDDSFVIITCAPATEIANIHDRMPVILPRDAEDAWLDPANDALDTLLATYAGTLAAVEEPRKAPAQGDLFGG